VRWAALGSRRTYSLEDLRALIGGHRPLATLALEVYSIDTKSRKKGFREGRY
jgi:hypothetical protein